MNTPFYLERTFATDVKTLWKALTETELMKQWYFDIEHFKAELGFTFTFNGTSDSCEQYVHLCEVTEVIPEKKLSYSWQYQGYPGISHVSFELEAMGSKTKLKLTHTGLESFPTSNPDFAPHKFAEGWEHIIGVSLEAHLKES
jgi:uncharacterized protein YndB with AHSA1/START domain